MKHILIRCSCTVALGCHGSCTEYTEYVGYSNPFGDYCAPERLFVYRFRYLTHLTGVMSFIILQIFVHTKLMSNDRKNCRVVIRDVILSRLAKKNYAIGDL